MPGSPQTTPRSAIDVLDVRFPTSRLFDGSDSMNPDLGYSVLAAKFGVPVCPHAGGVGLCELVHPLSVFDDVRASGQLEGRMIEHVDHLHEHFLDLVVIDGGWYRVPSRPGDSAQMQPETLSRFAFVAGAEWAIGKE